MMLWHLLMPKHQINKLNFHDTSVLINADAIKLEIQMETYTYVNIFETKGLEYILLICFLVLLIFFVRYLSSSKRKVKKVRKEVEGTV